MQLARVAEAVLTFYILAAALTALACLSILLPFIRQESAGTSSGRDIDVYREQLAEIDADEAGGRIGAAEAGEARAELGRRILRAAGAEKRTAASTASGRWLALIAIGAIPLVSMAMYWTAGAPGLADQPLAARLQGNPAESSIEELVARTERHLLANPEDGRGWSVIAPVYLRLGRHEDAVGAYRKAIELADETPELLAGLGEALAAEEGGRVTAEARATFEKALAMQPGHEKSQFFLALAQAQAGEFPAAVAGWQSLVANAAEGSPWPDLSRQALAEAEGMMASNPDDKGPDGAALQAAGEMTAPERSEMIEGMVASLAARLEAEPKDPEGWKRLIRSYTVLGRQEDAHAALARAQAALADDAQAAAGLETLARELKLTGG